MAISKKPGIEEIKQVFSKCEQLYGKTFESFRRSEKLYELDFKNELRISKEIESQGWKGVVLPTGRDAIDTAVSHTNLFHAEVHVNRKGKSDADEAAQRMEKALYTGIIYNANLESSISPWIVAGKHFWIYGRAVLRDTWDADMWLDKPLQKDSESDEAYKVRLEEWRDSTYERLPLKIEAVNPCSFMSDPSYGEQRYVFETHEQMVFDTKKMYPSWKNPLQREITDNSTYTMYWDKDFRCDLIDGEPVIPVKGGVVKHKYGFIPYVSIDSNLGNVSSDNAIDKRYVGLLKYCDDLLVSESRSYSIRDVVLAKTAYPTRHIEGDTAGVQAKYEDKFGVVNVLPPNTKLMNDDPQLPPNALNYHLGDTSDRIASHAAPRAAQGLAEEGVRSAVDRQQIAAQASARYAYSTPAFAMGTAKVLTNCARIIKNVIKENVRVWARTPAGDYDMVINPDKLKEPFTCSVEFSPISEEDEYRRHDDYERLLAAGIVPKNWIRERMSNVDSESVELQEMVDILKMSPSIAQMTDQYLAGKMAAVLSVKDAASKVKSAPPPQMNPQMGLAQTGEMPQGNRMIPPSSPKPAPGTAAGLQNAMRKMRSQTSMTQQGKNGGGNNG
jgi:hypothetical protein